MVLIFLNSNTITMNFKSITFILFCFSVNIASAQNKYALLIGIDKYSPPAGYKPSSGVGRIVFPDLDGCKNDARAMASIALSKFSFPAENIDTLFDEKASRETILKNFDRLLSRCKKGDVAFIYYAGHGSQVKNSRSKEGDGKDESIVPSDTWKEGVSDIRDKEFANICNQFLDKGIKLTVIMDCCHSGSLSRGPVVPGKFRYIASSNIDANDPSTPAPPETRPEGSFLIISAAQDNEFAQEQNDDNGNAHGAFTIALMTALNQQTVDASALNLFTSLRAILKGNGKKQEPVIGGMPERQRQTLFGLEKGSVPDRSLVPVIRVRDSKVELQGGIALSLNKGNELVKVYNGKDSVLLRIDSIIGINKSEASVLKGDIKNIQSGQLFEVTNWVSSNAPLIKLFVPGANMSEEKVNKILKIAGDLKASKQVFFVEHIDQYDPAVTIYFEGEKCFINNDGKRKQLVNYSAAVILAECRKTDTVFMEIPPTSQVAGAIINKFKDYKSIKLVDNINDAHYVVYGVASAANKVSYGLRRIQVSSKDSLESLPLTTRLIDVSFQNKESFSLLADTLFDFTLRLSKIRGWLNLVSPVNVKANFPFSIKLKYTDLDKTLDTMVYRIDEKISLYLVANTNSLSSSVSKKFIYVFAIDKNGKMTLGYPGAEEGNVENKFPKYDNNSKLIPEFKLLDFTVSEPTGTDNFFLLATDEPITNYAILFDQDGVNDVDTRGAEEVNPLADILNIGNRTKARSGFEKKTPSNWCLVKLSVKSTH